MQFQTDPVGLFLVDRQTRMRTKVVSEGNGTTIKKS